MNDNDRKIIASAYLDGALDKEETEWFENDLKDNPQTVPHLETIRSLQTTLRALQADLPPHSVSYNYQRVKAQLRGARPVWSFPSWLFPKLVPVAAIGCVLILVWSVLNQHELSAVEIAWSPDPEVSVSTFRSGEAQVIWASGFSYQGGE